jgi:hypothetical protein
MTDGPRRYTVASGTKYEVHDDGTILAVEQAGGVVDVTVHAMGDDDGPTEALLVVSDDGREWVPEGTPEV